MSTFVPTKHNLREALLFCFHLKKSAADGHRLLCEAYGEHAPSIKTCEYWFRRFKNGDFDTSDKEREGRPVKFEDAELEELLDQDSCQTQEELAKTLRVTQQAISNRLKAMGILAEQHFTSYEEAKNWVDSWIASKDQEFFQRGIRMLPERWGKIVANDGQYFE